MSGFNYNRLEVIAKKSDEFVATIKKALELLDEIPPGNSGAARKTLDISRVKLIEARMWTSEACNHAIDGR